MAETPTIGPPPLCPGVGQFAPMSNYTFYGVCIECGGYAFLMPDGTAGAHWHGGFDPANPVCGHRGPRIAHAGSPLCVRPQTDGHGDGEHMAHESWGGGDVVSEPTRQVRDLIAATIAESFGAGGSGYGDAAAADVMTALARPGHLGALVRFLADAVGRGNLVAAMVAEGVLAEVPGAGWRTGEHDGDTGPVLSGDGERPPRTRPLYRLTDQEADRG